MKAKQRQRQNKESSVAEPTQTPDEVFSPSSDPDSNILDQPENSFSSPSNKIQILDFHTPNPLVSFNEQLYTCSWTTTLGTDIILNPTDPSSHELQNPVLTTTRHKLSALPASLVPRRDPRPFTSLFNTTSPQNPIDPTPPDGPKPPQIPLEPHATVARKRQAAFLEKLIAIKAAKGEPDEVTVVAVKQNTGTGWRSRERARKREKAARDQEKEENLNRARSAENPAQPRDEEEEQGDPSHNPPARRTTQGGRPRGRSRAPSRALPRAPFYRGRKYKGTFFQGADRHPRSDLGGESIPTPRRWEDLDGGGVEGVMDENGT